MGVSTYATTRWSSGRKPSKAKMIVIPVVVAGGVVMLRKVRSNGDNGGDASADRPLGPVASADTVSPPADAAAEAAKAESAS
jgi:hypothetical protein